MFGITIGEKTRSILKGAVIAAGGAALTALGQYAGSVDLGEYGVAVAAAVSIVINAIQKQLQPTPA